MALEIRDIRPYKNLEGIQELFRNVELNAGKVRERGYGTLDLTEFDYKEAEIKLIAGKEIVSEETEESEWEIIGFKEFATEFKSRLSETELSPEEISFLIIAKSSYLKIIKHRKISMEELGEFGNEIIVATSDERWEPFRMPKHGCDVIFAAILDKDRQRSPLTPYRAGTWLGKAEFRLKTDGGRLGIETKRLTQDIKDKYLDKKDAIRYVHVEDVLDPEKGSEDISLYVDPGILDHLELQENSIGSQTIQGQLAQDVITAIILDAQKSLKGRTELPKWDEIEGSIVSKLIQRGDTKMTLEEKETRLLNLLLKPQVFINSFELNLSHDPRRNWERVIRSEDN